MTKLKPLSAALIVAAMLVTPAMACTRRVTSRHLAKDANANVSPSARYILGRVGIGAPRAFGTRPAPGGVCDVGDNPFIC